MLRSLIRLVLLVSWTSVVVPPIAAMNGVIGLYDRGWIRWAGCVPTRDRWVSVWAAGCQRILNVHVTVRGTVPEPPFFLVANHLGYIDVVLLQGLTPCAMVAKKDVRGWPVVGALAAIGGTVFIDRRAHRDILRVNETLEQALDRGQGVAIFPEGTSSKGEEVLPFRASLLAPIAATQRPVHTAAIHYRTPEGAPPAETHVCWWGDMTFADHVWGLLGLPRIDATVTFGRSEPTTGDRKALAEALETRVRTDFMPVGT